MFSADGLSPKGLPLILLLIFKAVLVSSNQSGLLEFGIERNPGRRAERIAQNVCSSQFGADGPSFEKCRMKVIVMLLSDRERLNKQSEKENVMTASMLRVLPCTREMCSKEENQSDLFECIRSKCIYKSAMTIPDEAVDGPISSLDTLRTSQFALRGGNNQQIGFGDASGLSKAATIYKEAAAPCLEQCQQDRNTGSSDQHCFQRCLLRMRHPQMFRRRPDEESLVKVGKRWSSRVCMEAHCKRFEVNGGQWFRCGQNNCGR